MANKKEERTNRIELFKKALRDSELAQGENKKGKYYPPVDHRWQPGESGNPRGRPPGSKNKPKIDPDASLAKMIVSKGKEFITSRDGTITKTKKEALIDAIFAGALAGIPRTQRLAANITIEAEAATRKALNDEIRFMVDYKFYWADVLEARKRNGIDDLPEPNPHPDDIHLFPHLGRVIIYGFYPPQVLKVLEDIKAIRDVDIEDLKLYLTLLEDPSYKKHWPMIEEDIQTTLKYIGRCDERLAWRPAPIHIPPLDT